MEVVPAHRQIKVEYVPADPLTSVREHGRAVSDKGAPIETKRRKIIATPLNDTVLARPVINPGDLSTNADRDCCRSE